MRVGNAASPGQIVILNGVPRSGKSSIAKAVQEVLPGVWINLGADAQKACTPPRMQPGVGLRPGAHQVSPAIEECVPVLFAALYESIAAHARLGLNVVADVYHHDRYTVPRGILYDCAGRLTGLPVLFVGVVCPLEVVWERREATWGQARGSVEPDVVVAVELGQAAVHAHGGYDLEVDTSVLSAVECSRRIGDRLGQGPPGSRFAELAK